MIKKICMQRVAVIKLYKNKIETLRGKLLLSNNDTCMKKGDMFRIEIQELNVLESDYMDSDKIIIEITVQERDNEWKLYNKKIIKLHGKVSSIILMQGELLILEGIFLKDKDIYDIYCKWINKININIWNHSV